MFILTSLSVIQIILLQGAGLSHESLVNSDLGEQLH